MWLEELRLENVRCFEDVTLEWTRRDGAPCRWITLLGDNGGGKTTVLQALGLLLAGPEGAQKLLPRPPGWPRDDSQPGKIALRLHQGDDDPGQYGNGRTSRSFGYTFYLTGSRQLRIRNRTYSEPTLVPSAEKRLNWLRDNALISQGHGWFAVGYGAFRRLPRSAAVLLPSLEPPGRYTNFLTQFNEDEPLSTFEQWMVYLDYRIAKENDSEARRWRDLGVRVIDRLLPAGARFDQVTSEGRIVLDIQGRKVPTLALSDGYRSVLALVGDLVWRLIQAFPGVDDPCGSEGVVLIDELDIHLHPLWQREIAGLLRRQFPRLQFIVATHSPLVAAGAGDDALTLRFRPENGHVRVEEVDHLSVMNVDRILESPAFGLRSPYSPDTQSRIDRYDELARLDERTAEEDEEYERLREFMEQTRPIGGPPAPGSLDAKIEAYLATKLS